MWLQLKALLLLMAALGRNADSPQAWNPCIAVDRYRYHQGESEGMQLKAMARLKAINNWGKDHYQYEDALEQWSLQQVKESKLLQELATKGNCPQLLTVQPSLKDRFPTECPQLRGCEMNPQQHYQKNRQGVWVKA